MGRIIAVIIAAVVVIALVAGSAAIVFGGSLGSGNVVAQTRSVSGFNRIAVHGIGNLIIDQTGQESLKVEAEDNLMDKIVTEVNNGTLSIRYNTGWWPIWPRKDINYYLTVKDVQEISISGSGSVRSSNLKTTNLNLVLSGSGKADLKAQVEQLSSQVSGSGDITVSGTAARQSLGIGGSGTYRARDLASKEASITVSGSGHAVVNATQILNVTISGSGDISYLNSPQINQQISGSGKVVKLNE